MDFEGGGNASYGLRENPKKSWRVSDPKHGTSKKENLCKKCGKGFHTLRALSGHMRCHSMEGREENLCKKCGKGFDSMRALFGHMRSHSKRSRVSNESVESQSDYEAACPIRKKRSRTRGVKNWDGFISVTESSDNNSVIFEAQLSNPSKEIAKSDGGKLVCLGDEAGKMMNPGAKLDSCVSGSGNVLLGSCEFDSGFASNDEKKVELEVSVDEILGSDEFKKPKLDDESGIELLDTEIEKRSESIEVELEKDLTKEVVLDQAESKFLKSTSSKKARFDVHDSELRGNSFDRTNSNSQTECKENSLGQDANGVAMTSNELKKSKDRECPICFKVFASGQALGGHKRAHYVGLSESRTKETMLIEQEFPDIQNIFDLNLPVTLEKEVNDDAGFKLWWVGSDHEREPLVISN
ncbi:hypothetical protein F0562_005131 [Nyssa sinensis]|uniref:C2H2-type domain-containing protein n=1 Tax=Nyssa sinensis TaxID=561372 RepID=A0A5J5AKU7_9ASTE|nr:hypothetical protein F0562_005131 [Nyssa sinensis]